MRRKSTFEEELLQRGSCTYFNVGTSMMPLLRQRKDLIHLVRPEGRLKKYDVPLFKRDNGQYVLHRIVAVRPDSYVLCGDNQIYKEKGITDRQIIGVMDGITRNGKYFPVTSLRYRMYVRIWCGTYWLRWPFFRIRSGFRFLRRKMKTL